MSNFIENRPLLQNFLPAFAAIEKELGEEDESPLTMEAETIVEDAFRAKATDIHLDPMDTAYRIRLRVDGMMVDAFELSKEVGERITKQFKTLCKLNPLPSLSYEEGSVAFDQNGVQVDLRITAVPCSVGTKVAIRILEPPSAITRLEDVGLSQEGIGFMRHWLDAVSGMLLVVGPTGSGKSTTLYTLLHQLKMTNTHVLTLEQPIEYQVPGINQIQVDPDNGIDFASGAEALLRLDPDYVLLGEIRSPKSAQAALNIASSGRSLMATLHSKDAVGAISSLRNLGLDDYEIAANVSLVVAQRLVRKLCTACREEVDFEGDQAEWIKSYSQFSPEKVWKAKGCKECNGMGYKGRLGIFEVWYPSEEDYARIAGHADEFELRQYLIERGFRLMLDDGLEKVADGLTSIEELIRVGTLGPAIHSLKK